MPIARFNETVGRDFEFERMINISYLYDWSIRSTCKRSRDMHASNAYLLRLMLHICRNKH